VSGLALDMGFMADCTYWHSYWLVSIPCCSTASVISPRLAAGMGAIHRTCTLQLALCTTISHTSMMADTLINQCNSAYVKCLQ